MSTPYEILAAPFSAWLAVANTAEPVNLDVTPPVAYTKLGASGSAGYDESGVSVQSTQTLQTFRGLGKTGNLKVWRDTEEVEVDFTVYDMTAEAYGKILNNIAVTTTATASGISGAKRIAMLLGYDVSLFTLLLRSDQSSPYGDGMITQYWLPLCYQASNPKPTFGKGKPGGLDCNFKTLQDLTNGFGGYRAENALSS